jgi:hypothetical protein
MYHLHLQRYRVNQARNQQKQASLGFLIDPEDGGDMLLCNVRLTPTTWRYKPEGCTLHSHCCANLNPQEELCFSDNIQLQNTAVAMN